MRHHAIAAALVLLCCCGTSHAQSSDVSWYTIDGGGSTSTDGFYSISGTIGQPDAGVAMSGGNYSVTGGYWTGTTNFCRADFNGDQFVDFFDFSDFVNCFEGGDCPPGKTADYNGDGFPDFFDFSDFVTDFETGCP